MKSDDRAVIEYDIDTENPREVSIVIRCSVDMTGQDLYDAIHYYLYKILKPEISKGAKDCKDISKH